MYIDMIKRKDDMLPYWSKNDGYDHVLLGVSCSCGRFCEAS